MSKKEKPKKPEAPAADAAGGEEGAPAKKKMAGKTLVLFVILPAVLVLGGGGAAAMMLMGGGGAPAEAATVTEGEHVTAEEGHGEAPAADHGGGGGGEHGEAASGDHGEGGAGGSPEDEAAIGRLLPCESGNPCYYAMPKLVMNLASTGGGRATMMELELSLESSTPSSFNRVPDMMPRLKDTLNSFLRELRVEDLNGSGGTYTLRRELLKRFNTVLDPKKIDAVLIEGMLIQ
jgi:flagellar FliL protein